MSRLGNEMHSVRSINEWPIAAISVSFRGNKRFASEDLSSEDIIELISEACNIPDDGKTPQYQLVETPYYYDGDNTSLTITSTSGEVRFYIMPHDDEPELPFFLEDENYMYLRVLAYTWARGRIMQNHSNQEIITAAKEFASRLESVLHG